MKECCKIKEDPKWNFNRPCLQDHEHTEVYYNYTTTVKVLNPFNVPRFGEEMELKLDRVISILPGSILWNLRVGGLTVKSFDKDTSTVIVTPKSINVDYGTAVLANTEFTVGIPIVDSEGKAEYLDSPYLAADFVSPGDGSCQEVSVTSVSGLSINDKVSIAGYVYRIGAIVNRSTLRLCNDGQGAANGVVIQYDPQDCGEPSVPVIVYESNPCEATPVQTGQIVVCKDNGLTTIKGEADGQMLRWSNNYKRWELVNAYIESNCTYLTTCLTIDTLEQPYVATVKTTTIFNLDNKVIIDDKKFVVKEIVNETQMKIQPEETFDEIVTYPVGTNVCLESCCAWVPQVLADTVQNPDWIPEGLLKYDLTPKSIDSYKIATNFTPDSSWKLPTPVQTTLPVLSAGGSFTLTTDTITIVNTNSTHYMSVRARMYSYAHGAITHKAGADNDNRVNIKLENVVNVTYYEWDSVNLVEVPKSIPWTEFDLKSAPVHTTDDKPYSVLCSQETVLVNLPPYNEDHYLLSTITLEGKTIVDVISGSSSSLMWKQNMNAGSVIAHLVIDVDLGMDNLE